MSGSGVWPDDIALVHPDLIDGHTGPGLAMLGLSAQEEEESLLALFERHVNPVNSYKRERHLIMLHMTIIVNERAPCTRPCFKHLTRFFFFLD